MILDLLVWNALPPGNQVVCVICMCVTLCVYIDQIVVQLRTD